MKLILENWKRFLEEETRDKEQGQGGVQPTPTAPGKRDGDPCWDGYKQEGTKPKDGKQVPNCVPIKEDLDEDLDENLDEKKKKKKKKPCKPAKGKKSAKRVDGKCRSFGQAGQAKGGGPRIRPGTKKGDAYCARSLKIKKCKNPPCANALSRKKWKCKGAKSVA